MNLPPFEGDHTDIFMRFNVDHDRVPGIIRAAKDMADKFTKTFNEHVGDIHDDNTNEFLSYCGLVLSTVYASCYSYTKHIKGREAAEDFTAITMDHIAFCFGLSGLNIETSIRVLGESNTDNVS